MRQFTFTTFFAGIALLAVTYLVVVGRSSLAGQGKGGEVVAKPTPAATPKKTSPRMKPPASNSRTGRTTKSTGVAASAAERAFWSSIKDSTNPAEFKAYLKKYPKGEFAALAANRLKALEEAKRSTDRAPANPKPTNPGPTNSLNSTPKVIKAQTGVEIEMTSIPPGTFTMGDERYADQRPAHPVTIREGFYMGRYEVTIAEWRAVMGDTEWEIGIRDGNKQSERQPVLVSWKAAKGFIAKLNSKNSGYVFRLPTEAEWEYACRAGTTTIFAFGDDLSSDQANFDGRWPARKKGILRDKTMPVGSFSPNGFGLYDMHGNASEWCEDWYHDTYSGAPVDGSAWLGGREHEERVLRGGAYNDPEHYLGSAFRRWSAPGNRWYGFRIVATARTQ